MKDQDYGEFENIIRQKAYAATTSGSPAYKNRLVIRVESGVSKEHARKLAAEARQDWLRGASARISKDRQ